MKILAIFGCVTMLALVSPVHAQTASSAQSPAAAQQQAAQQQRQAVQQQQLARDQEKMQRDQQKLEQDRQALERDQQGMAQHQQALELDQQQLERQMQQARREMQQAAQRMAQLSLQMQGPMLAHLSRVFDPNRAVLGISIADSRDSQNNIAGVRVEAVTPGGPADQAGLRAGDTITAINGVRFQSTDKQSAADQLMSYMDKVKPGDSLKLAYLRDGQAHAVTLKAGRLADYSFAFTLPPLPPVPLAPPVPPVAPVPPVPPIQPNNLRALFPPGWWGAWGDMQLTQLTPGLGQYFGTDKGLLVVRAPRDAALKLQDGDVILKIGDREPATPAEAVRILYSYEPGKTITLNILRKGKSLGLKIIAPKTSGSALGPYHPMSASDR